MKKLSLLSTGLITILTVIVSCRSEQNTPYSEVVTEAVSEIETEYQDLLQYPQEYVVKDTARLNELIQILSAADAKNTAGYVKGLLLKSGHEYLQEDYPTAIRLLEEALSLTETLTLSNYPLLESHVLNQQGLNYMYAKQYYSALNCINRNINICLREGFDEMLVSEYGNKGNLLYYMGQTTEGIALSRKALSLNEKTAGNNRNSVYKELASKNNLAITLHKEGQYLISEGRVEGGNDLLAEADDYLTDVIEKGKSVLSAEMQIFIKMSIINRAAGRALMSETNYTEQTIDGLKQLDSLPSHIAAFKYNILSALEAKRKNFDVAKIYNDSSLLLFNYDVKQTDMKSGMIGIPSELKERVIQAMSTRALIYYKKYEAYANREDLLTSMDLFRKTVKGISDLGTEIKDILRLNSLRSLHMRTYRKAVIAAKELYAVTGDKDYLEESFRIKAEGSSFILRQHIQRKVNEANYQGDDSAFFKRDVEQQKQLGLLQSTYVQSDNQNEKRDIEDAFVKLLRERNAFLDSLKNSKNFNIRQYYAGRYDTAVPSLRDLRTSFLNDTTAIIDYFSADNQSFAYVLTKSKFFTVELTPTDTIARYIDNLQQQMRIEGSPKGFKESAHVLYKTYFAPVQQVLPAVKHFIISPNEQMHGLSFGTFLSQSPNHLDLHDYPFLIKDYYFSYVYSLDAQYLFRKLYANRENNRENLGVFIADYTNPNNDENTVNDLRCSEKPLPAMKTAALTTIPDYFPANHQVYKAASVADFTENSTAYDYLHLSMHGCTQTSDPLNYSLVFTGDELTVGEIYNSDIRAKLAVIASCSANAGPLQRGEGPATISRAFSIAGCPNLITTLNEIYDKQTAVLLEHFYYYLIKKQQRPAVALANAKRKYLATKGNRANLVFWANVVSVGVTSNYRIENQ